MGLATLRNRLRDWKIAALDTSVIVYQLLNHPDYAPLTDMILHAIETGRLRGVTTTITLAEILTKAEQEADAQVAIDYEMYLTLFPNLTLLPVDVPLARAAARIRAQFRLKLPDAIQVAAAALARADVLITNDRDLQKKVSEPVVILLSDFV
jgi:predicted nucleic acid-binding protein